MRPIVLAVPLVLGGVVLLASRVAAARESERESELRAEILRVVLDPAFDDWGQAEIAAQWLDAHGYHEDARNVREDKWRKFYEKQRKAAASKDSWQRYYDNWMKELEKNPSYPFPHPQVSGIERRLSYPTGAAARESIARTMRAYHRGSLTSRGIPVTKRKQALAIALNRARRRVGAEIGYLPDAPALLAMLRSVNRQLPEIGGCVGWWWSSSSWWTLGITPPGGRTAYKPFRYLTDAAAAEWAIDETEANWNASVQRWKWTGDKWMRA